jgi:membrane-associated phospholipid phosphatase
MVIAATTTVMAALGGAAFLAVRRWPDRHLLDPQAWPAPQRRWSRTLARRTDPTTATGLFLTVTGGLVVAGGLGVAVLLAMVRQRVGFAQFDRSLAQWGADNATAASTDFLHAITWFGGTTGVVAVAALAGLVAHRRAPTGAIFGFLALVVGGQLLITNIIKALVDRERPDIGPLSSFAGPSFPSGHAAAAAACFAAVALVLGRRRSLTTKAALAGVAGAMAGGVAASRVLLGVHWLTDVIAGVLLGWGWFAVCSIGFGGRLLRFGAPVEAAAPRRISI